MKKAIFWTITALVLVVAPLEGEIIKGVCALMGVLAGFRLCIVYLEIEVIKGRFREKYEFRDKRK